MLKQFLSIHILTLNYTNSVFRRFLRYIPRHALILCQLIDAKLIEHFPPRSLLILKSKCLPNVAPGQRSAAKG